MKKLSILLGVFLFAFSACKKDYTCSCSAYEYMGTTYDAVDYELGKLSKSDAEEACQLWEDINVLYDANATCEL
tara:strand:- start:7568 stop:7789 length:222 start_codon:yes stop_codon:yes gene_type:complete